MSDGETPESFSVLRRAWLQCRCKQGSFCVVEYNKTEEKYLYSSKWNVIKEQGQTGKKKKKKKVPMFFLWARTWRYQKKERTRFWTNYRDHPQTRRTARIDFHRHVPALLLEYASTVENVAALYFKCLSCKRAHTNPPVTAKADVSFHNNIIISL